VLAREEDMRLERWYIISTLVYDCGIGIEYEILCARNKKPKKKGKNITNRKNVFSFGFAEARTQFLVQSFGFKPVLAATKRPSLVKNQNKKPKKKGENITNRKNVFSFGFAEARTQFSVQSFGFKPVLAATKRPSLVGSHSHSAFMPMFSCLREHPGYPRSLASGSCKSIPIITQSQCLYANILVLARAPRISS
jgi:hypothetical protein